MQFPTQVQNGFYQSQPMPRGYPVGALPQPGFSPPFPQGAGYGLPPGYPMSGQPPLAGGFAPGMGGQFRGPQMSPFPQQPLLMGNRPFMMSPPQPYQPIHPDQRPLGRSNINTKIEEQKIHCVICEGDFLVSEKEQHAQRHARPRGQQGNSIKKLTKEYKQQYIGPKTRPIVEPEQYNVQYNPNEYIVEQTFKYQTPVMEKRQPPQRKQIGVGTGNSRQAQMQPISQSQAQPIIPVQPLPPQNQSVAFQPQTVRLTNDGQQIVHNTGNVYDAAAQRRFRESQLSNNNIRQPSVQPSVQPSNDARFTRNTFISDQPVPAVQPMDNPTMRQTIYTGSPQVQQSNAPRMVSSRQPGDAASISQSPSQPVQDMSMRQPSVNQKVQLDEDHSAVNSPYRSSYERKYDANDYVRQTQTTPTTPVIPVSNSISNPNPYNSMNQPLQNVDTSRISNAPSMSQQNMIQPTKLQASRPSVVQNISNISNDIDQGYGRSPDDKIIPRETRTQQPQQSSSHDYFPFQTPDASINDPRITNTQAVQPRLTNTQQPRMTYTQPTQPRMTNVQPTQPRMTNVSNIQPTQPRLTNVSNISNIQPVQPRLTNTSNIQPTQPRMTNVSNIQPAQPRLTNVDQRMTTTQNPAQIRMSQIINQKIPSYQTAGNEASKLQQQPANTSIIQSGTPIKNAQSFQMNSPALNQSVQSAYKPTNTVQPPANDNIQSFDYPQRTTTVQPAQQSIRQPTQNFQQSFNQSVSQPPSNQSFQQPVQPTSLDTNRMTNNAGTSQRLGADVSLTQNYQPAPLPIIQNTTTANTTARKKLPRFVGTEW